MMNIIYIQPMKRYKKTLVYVHVDTLVDLYAEPII